MMLVILSYMLASWLRLEFLDGDSKNMAGISLKTILLAVAYSLIFFFLLSIFGFYNTTRTRKLTWKARTIFLSATISTLITTTIFFVFRLIDFSRGVILVFYFVTILLLTGKYTFMRLVLRRIRGNGYNLKHVVVIGTGKLAKQYRDDITKEAELGFHIIGFVGNQNLLNEEDHWLGSFKELDSILSSPDISEVIIALDPEEYSGLWQIIPACEKNGVKYSVIPFYNDIIPANPVIETIGHSKLINMRANRLENMGWAILKRAFDFFSSFTGIIVLSPLLIIIAIGVKLSSPGPILFKQKRVGKNGQHIWIYKIRSMRMDAEDMKQELMDDNLVKDGMMFKMDFDPRIIGNKVLPDGTKKTGIGEFIRRTSLDEFPQFFNVLTGSMSTVGTRPPTIDEYEKYHYHHRARMAVKPGITGMWQVSGRSEITDFEEVVRLDTEYISNWSLGLDLKILLKTIGVVFTGRGAK